MPNYSQYKKLELPTSGERYNIDIFNQNNQIIDSELHDLETKISNVENKSSEQIRSELTSNDVINALGYTPYTPNEVDNKLSAIETNIDWKEAVDTYEDIAATYPRPEDGWTVNVKDTDYTYRYNGAEWVVISANAIPKATDDVDGLLCKEDHANYDDANSKKHTHDNKSVLDGITAGFVASLQELVDERTQKEEHSSAILIGETAPDTNSTIQVWIDTSNDPAILKYRTDITSEAWAILGSVWN